MNYEIGDIIFFRSIPRKDKKWYYQLFTKLQSIFDGKVSHVEIIYEYNPITKVAKTFGSNADGTKFRYWDIERKDIAIGRFKGGLNQYKAKYILDILVKTRNNTPYSNKGLLNASINTFLDKIFPKMWKKKTIIKEEKNTFCSELVGEYLEMMNFKKLSRKNESNINNNELTPSDIYESYDIIILKDFE